MAYEKSIICCDKYRIIIIKKYQATKYSRYLVAFLRIGAPVNKGTIVFGRIRTINGFKTRCTYHNLVISFQYNLPRMNTFHHVRQLGTT